jgi:hypothetical protein
VIFQHKDAASCQRALRQAGNETEQQDVERIAVHVGKVKFFRTMSGYFSCDTLFFTHCKQFFT